MVSNRHCVTSKWLCHLFNTSLPVTPASKKEVSLCIRCIERAEVCEVGRAGQNENEEGEKRLAEWCKVPPAVWAVHSTGFVVPLAQADSKERPLSAVTSLECCNFWHNHWTRHSDSSSLEICIIIINSRRGFFFNSSNLALRITVIPRSSPPSSTTQTRVSVYRKESWDFSWSLQWTYISFPSATYSCTSADHQCVASAQDRINLVCSRWQQCEDH